ncbi:MAG: ELWxxDGT repeat protein [Thermoanaerobaculia bacterium]
MRSAWIAEAFVCLILAAAPARAGEAPYLLADINRSPAGGFDSYGLTPPTDFFELGGRLLFSTANSQSEDEGILWSTDGTAAGTFMVSSSLCPSSCARVSLLAVWRGVAFLSSTQENGSATSEPTLWRTDGTPRGTVRLAGPFEYEPLFPSAFYASPDVDTVYFNACDSKGCGLWRSDGTPAGTFPMRGPDGASAFSSARSLALWRGRAYFVAYLEEEPDHYHGGLWSSDGTPGGTRFVADVQDSENPARLVATPSHLFFDSGPTTEDLWVTDGTPENTRRLIDFPLTHCDPYDHECAVPDVDSMVAFGDAVYFRTRRAGHGVEIWRSDGTEAGSRPLIELPSGVTDIGKLDRLAGRWIFPGYGTPSGFWTADDAFTQAAPLTGPSPGELLSPPGGATLLFAGTDADHGTELWITDGTGPGTRRLTDACPGPCPALRHHYGVSNRLGGAAGRFYFRAYTSADARDFYDDELWVTDGSPEGTHHVAGHASAPGFLGALAFFGTTDPRRATDELWATDGTPDGTRRVIPLRRRAASSFPSLFPFRDGALLIAYDGEGPQQLWRSNGTPAGTFPIHEFKRGSGRSFSDRLATLGPLTLFKVYHRLSGDDNPASEEIWSTDGSGEARKVVELDRRLYIDLSTTWQGRLLFTTGSPAGCSFWISDGTAAGTREILPPRLGTRCPTMVTALGSRFLFVARVGSADHAVPQLFLSDGMPAGTRQISAVHGEREPFDYDTPVQIGGTVFFRLYDTARCAELWRTDGTPEGTRRASSLLEVDDLYGFQGSLYFTAYFPGPDDLRRGLFQLDPTGGPVLLAPVTLDVYSYYYPLAQFSPLGDRLLFTAQDKRGVEPWVTDGTPEGTHRLADLQPGPGSSSPSGLVSTGRRVYFSADDGIHGRELWESDGTPEGTRMVQDVNPGGFTGVSFQYAPIVSNGYLFFAADDGKTGFEPWALPLEP